MTPSTGSTAAWFASFAKSARFQFWMGLSIAGAGISEVITEVEHFMELAEISAVHGVVLVGLLHATKGLGEVIEGGTQSRESRVAHGEIRRDEEMGE